VGVDADVSFGVSAFWRIVWNVRVSRTAHELGVKFYPNQTEAECGPAGRIYDSGAHAARLH